MIDRILRMLVVACLVLAAGKSFADEDAQGKPANSDPAKEIPAWQLVREEETTDNNSKTFVDCVAVSEPPITIPLRSSWESESCVDTGTLSVAWLSPGKIKWIHWCDKPSEGSGAYRTEAHIVVLLAPSPRELLRESFLKSCKVGTAGHHQNDTVYKLSEESRDRFIISRETDYQYADDGLPNQEPLSVKTQWGIWKQFRIRQMTEYRVDLAAPAKPSHTTNRAWLDLTAPPLFKTGIAEYQDHVYSLSEVAEFLIDHLRPYTLPYGQKIEIGPEERTAMEGKIQVLNPNLTDDKPFRAVVELPCPDAVIKPLAPGDDFYPFRGCGQTHLTQLSGK